VDRRQKTRYYCKIALAWFPKLPKTYSVESRDIPCFRLPHCFWTPSLQGTPSNIGTNLILPETTVIGLHLRRWQPDSIDEPSFEFSRWAPKDARVLKRSASWPFKVIQDRWFWHQSKAKRVYDFLFDLNSNLGPILARFRDITAFVHRKPLFTTRPLFRRKVLRVPLGVDPWRLGCKERTPQANWPWNYFRRIPTYVITIHQRYRQTDGQTDRQTTCNRKTALCTKVHRAVKSPVLSRFTNIRAFVRRKPLFQHPTPIRGEILGVPLGINPWCCGLQWANTPC